jgi:hypothetical protein
MITRLVVDEVGKQPERVHAGRYHDVDVDFGVDGLEVGNRTPEPEHGQVDDGADAAGSDPAERLHRLGDPGFPRPLPAVGRVVVVDLAVEDEHVLVHERGAQPARLDRTTYRLDQRHHPSPSRPVRAVQAPLQGLRSSPMPSM